MNPLPPEAQRRRRLATRSLPLAALALAAFVTGVAAGTGGSPRQEAAKRFAAAWERQDFAAMYGELSPASRRAVSTPDFAIAYLDAQRVSTLRTIEAAEPEELDEGAIRVPLTVSTLSFGRLAGEIELRFEDGGIAWAPALTFPGLRRGEELEARLRLAPRAPILARDGSGLAVGPATARTHPLGDDAIDVTGQVGEADPEDVERLAEQGFTPETPVGVSGIEQAFNTRLAGRPGGELLAVPGDGGEPRLLAAAEPRRGRAVRTTVDPTLQEAAVAALAGRLGGIAVLDARNGAVRALAGQAFSAPQPPGSIFKVITTTAALREGDVSFDDEFPVVDGANAGGRFIYNAHQELCGGDFRTAFAQSCNSVFAPLGVDVGEDELVATAERYGFNSEPTLYNEAATRAVDPPDPTIPTDPGDDVDLAVTAIGQGEVLATPLAMASVAQTVAGGGVRMPTPIVVRPELRAGAAPVRVSSRRIATQLTELMVGVVTGGTGSLGAIPEAQVAGKTGTAELGPKPGQEDLPPDAIPEQIVDAWFIAFAPAERPQLAIAVMLVDADADGGTVAAPAAAQVLSAGL